jgi:hypothetical protein
LSIERQTDPTKLTQEGLRITHDGFTFPVDLGDIIARHKFEFHDGKGNIYWVEFRSEMLKELLGEALQRTIEDKSRIYKLTPDDLQVDLFQRQVFLIVEAFDRLLLRRMLVLPYWQRLKRFERRKSLSSLPVTLLCSGRETRAGTQLFHLLKGFRGLLIT